MTVQQKIFALIIGAGLFLVIIELVRRRKLAEEYSFLWLLTGFGIIVLILWYDLLSGLRALSEQGRLQQLSLSLALCFCY